MRPASHSRYLLAIAAICLMVAGAIVASTTGSFYYRHSTSFWDVVEEHQFSVRGQKADILFVGDSSLLFGVSSDEISRETGLGVYSLGVAMPALAIDRDLLIAQYLAHNEAPRLMVLYISAAMRAKAPFAFPPTWYEGETMLMRYGDAGRAIDFFSANDTEISRFLALAGRRILAFDWTGRNYRTLAAALDVGHGYVVPPQIRILDTDRCPISDSPILPDEEFIQRFRKESAARNIPAAVYLAPLPDCDPRFAATSTQYSRFVDNVPYTLPHGLFVDDLQREHLVSAGARQNSRIVATFLNRFITTSQPGAQAP
jgi:hypothetical protein